MVQDKKIEIKIVSLQNCKKGSDMTSYILTVNESRASGKVLLNYLKSLSKTDDYVYIMPQKEASPYDPEFVAKIKRSMESEGKAIKLEDL